MARRTSHRTVHPVELRTRRRAVSRERHADRQRDRVLRLTVVRPVARTALTAGAVVWAHIPYEETDGYKLRPVVVIGVAGRDVTVYPGTTSERRHRHPWLYREISDIDTAGLRRATGIRLEPITVDRIDIVAVAGTLAPDDRRIVLGEPAGQPAGLALAA